MIKQLSLLTFINTTLLLSIPNISYSMEDINKESNYTIIDNNKQNSKLSELEKELGMSKSIAQFSTELDNAYQSDDIIEIYKLSNKISKIIINENNLDIIKKYLSYVNENPNKSNEIKNALKNIDKVLKKIRDYDIIYVYFPSSETNTYFLYPIFSMIIGDAGSPIDYRLSKKVNKENFIKKLNETIENIFSEKADHLSLEDRGHIDIHSAYNKNLEVSKHLSKIINSLENTNDLGRSVGSNLKLFININISRLRDLKNKSNFSEFSGPTIFRKAWNKNLSYNTSEKLQSFLKEINNPTIKSKDYNKIVTNFLDNIVFDLENLNIILKSDEKCFMSFLSILKYSDNIITNKLETHIANKCKKVVQNIQEEKIAVEPTKFLINNIKNELDKYIKLFEQIEKRNNNEELNDKLKKYKELIRSSFESELSKLKSAPLDYYLEKLYK